MSCTNVDRNNKECTCEEPDIIKRIKDYSQMVLDNKIPCLLGRCPRCGTASDQFKGHGKRKRNFNVIVDQTVLTVFGFLLRWVCPGCNKTSTQYPEFALPHKRYILPDMMKYIESYVENDKESYAHLMKKSPAGYTRFPGDEAQLSPMTIHRWISTLGNMPLLNAEALKLIHQKNPTAGIAGHLAQITIDRRKYTSEIRRKILIGCRRIVHIERLFHQIFKVSIFFKLAAYMGFS